MEVAEPPAITVNRHHKYAYYLTVYLTGRAAIADPFHWLTPYQGRYLKAWARKRLGDARRIDRYKKSFDAKTFFEK